MITPRTWKVLLRVHQNLDELRQRFTYNSGDEKQFDFYFRTKDDPTVPLNKDSQLPFVLYVEDRNEIWDSPQEMFTSMIDADPEEQVPWKIMVNTKTGKNLTELKKMVMGSGSGTESGKDDSAAGTPKTAKRKGGKKRASQSQADPAAGYSTSGSSLSNMERALADHVSATTELYKAFAFMTRTIAESNGMGKATEQKPVKPRGKPGPKPKPKPAPVQEQEQDEQQSSQPDPAPEQEPEPEPEPKPILKTKPANSKPKVQTTIDVTKTKTKPRQPVQKPNPKSNPPPPTGDSDEDEDDDAADSDAEMDKNGKVKRLAKGSVEIRSDEEMSEEDAGEDVDENGNLVGFVASDDDGADIDEMHDSDDDADYSQHSSADEDEDMDEAEEEHEQTMNRRAESKKRKRVTIEDDNDDEDDGEDHTPAPVQQPKSKIPKTAVPVTAIKQQPAVKANGGTAPAKRPGLAPPPKQQVAPKAAPPTYAADKPGSKPVQKQPIVGQQKKSSAPAVTKPKAPITVAAAPPCPDDGADSDDPDNAGDAMDGWLENFEP